MTPGGGGDSMALARPVVAPGDRIELLTHTSLRLAKRVRADGSVDSYDDAKMFTRREARVSNLPAFYELLRDALQGDPHTSIIRGRFRGEGQVGTDHDAHASVGQVRKALHYFDDQALHLVCCDVDKYAPIATDPLDPEAVQEFIALCLPPEFHGVGYVWQFSNSAGFKSGLRVHIWVWLDEPLTSAQLKAWAKGRWPDECPIDTALFHPTQWHYTAAPVLDPGVTDPVPVRCGFVPGANVRLSISEAARAAAAVAATPLAKPRDLGDSADHFVPKLFDLGLVLAEVPGKGYGVICPNKAEHTGDSGPTESLYFPAGVGGRDEPGFKCMHAHCEHLNATTVLRAWGMVNVADDFEVIVRTAEQEAEDALVRARNANRASGEFEAEAERSARIGREGSHTTPRQRIMSGTEMLEELVYIADGARVSFAAEPRFTLPLSEFKSFTAGSVDQVKGKGKLHRAQRWVESAERKTVRSQTFAPGRPAMCTSPDNVPAQNLWVPRKDPVPSNWRELVQPFFDHVAYLVPNEAERARFLDWLAHIEQQSSTLPATHYLLIAKQTGIGRNWLSYALARVFAGHTALGFDLGEALRSGFNGALSQTLLAVVDELHEGGPGGLGKPIAEKLKSMLTEATRRVNPKYGRQHVEFNCCRFLMFSNHESALPLADNDRRVVVLENPSTRKPEDYYTRLYRLLDEPGLGAALAEALRQRDISGFNPGEVAPMTAAKARTIRAGRSEVEQAVRDVAAEWPAECITSSRLQVAVSEALGGKTWNVQGACVSAGLVKFGGRVKVAGVAAHVWLLRDQHRWASAPAADVAREVLRGQCVVDGEAFA